MVLSPLSKIFFFKVMGNNSAKPDHLQNESKQKTNSYKLMPYIVQYYLTYALCCTIFPVYFKQKLLTLLDYMNSPPVFSGVRVYQSVVYVPFLFIIALSVLL